MLNRMKMMFLGTVLSGLMFATGAQADAKTYSAFSCMITSGSGAVYDYGAIGCGTNNYLYLSCPAVNDTYTDIESSWIMVKDSNASADVRCRILTMYSIVGNASRGGWIGSYQYSSGSDGLWQQLDLGAQSSAGDAGIYIECRIPPYSNGASYIGEYNVNE